MKCPNCQFENQPEARFCGYCGAAAVASQNPSNEIKCYKCGSLNPPDSRFCESCGNKLFAEQPAGSGPVSPASTGKSTSAAWWLMPIFLGWIGGVIGWLVVRESDKGKARGLLWTGIAMTVFWILVGIAGTMASFFLEF